jgi:hypothetical protein
MPTPTSTHPEQPQAGQEPQAASAPATAPGSAVAMLLLSTSSSITLPPGARHLLSFEQLCDSRLELVLEADATRLATWAARRSVQSRTSDQTGSPGRCRLTRIPETGRRTTDDGDGPKPASLPWLSLSWSGRSWVLRYVQPERAPRAGSMNSVRCWVLQGLMTDELNGRGHGADHGPAP